MKNILNKYKEYFPEIISLYDCQEKSLNSLLGNNNSLSIIPTGGGKSLIFQLAALESKGLLLSFHHY